MDERTNRALAVEWNRRRASRAARRAAQWGVIAVGFLIVAIVLCVVRSFTFALLSVGLAIMFTIMYVDARGQLREIREGGWSVLIPSIPKMLEEPRSTQHEGVNPQADTE